MDVTTFTALGRDLQARLRTFLDAPLGPDASALEMAQAALDDVERQAQPAPGGRRVFPFSRVTVRVCATEDAWPSIEAVFEDFGTRVCARLAEVRCETPRGLEARVACQPVGDEGPGVRVEYERAPIAAPTAAPPLLRATVLRGAALQSAWAFSDGTVLIGRTTESTPEGTEAPRNRLVFSDARDGVTETVGRAHARVRFDAAAGAYRVHDEGSHNGTSILRAGEVIVVPRRDPRGVRLRSGDELQLGRALVRFEIG